MSNIVLNIVEPGSSTPPIPDTGLWTNNSSIGSGEAPIIITISLVAILAIVAVIAIIYYRRKKQNKVTNNPITQIKQTYKTKKGATIGLSALALLVSIGTVAGLLKLGVNAEEADNAETQNNTSSLTVTTSDTELTVELSDEPVFAVLPVEVNVAEATPAGYTLTAYTDSTNLVSTADSSSVIPMVTIDNEELVALEANTYGLSLVKPESEEEKTYASLSTDSTTPTFITNKDYEATEEDDVTTIYYGFYITPDTPYGTYTGSAISYEAELNTATVIYDGNGLYFNNNEEQTTNMVKYVVGITDNTEKISHTPNINDEGVQDGIVGYHGGDILNQVITIPGAVKLNIELSYGGGYVYGYPGGYLSFWQGAHPDYNTNDNNGTAVQTCGSSDVTNGKFYGDGNDSTAIITVECELQDNSVTFAYWTSGGGPSNGPTYGYYAVVTGYDEDGNIIYLPGNRPIVGEYQTPSWDLPYKFLGWNTNKDATEPTYISANDVELNAPLAMGEITTFYAIWQYATNITFDGNGADGGVGLEDRLLIAGNGTALCDSNQAYTKTGYYFTGWNTEADGRGTSYGNCSWYTAPTDRSENITLYAQWRRITTTISFNGNGADSGSMDDITIIGGDSVTLPENSFTREGYTFTGWNTESDGSGISYENEADYTAPDYPTGLMLYAQWKQVFYMQDVATWGSNLEMGDEITAVDSRDGKEYYVARLADGNIWMTQNLDFDIVDGGAALDSTNTDVPANWADAGNLTNTYNDTTWNSSNTTPESYDPGNLYWNGELNTNWNGTLDTMTTDSGDSHYHIGNYYNWTAAVAMNDSSSYTTEYTDVNQSICPAGWRLPTYSGDKSYRNLVNTQSLTAGTSGNIQNTPVYFVYGGSWYGSSSAVGFSGNYWSSVVKSSGNSYRIGFFADGDLYPQYYGDRYFGYSLRCVAR